MRKYFYLVLRYLLLFKFVSYSKYYRILVIAFAFQYSTENRRRVFLQYSFDLEPFASPCLWWREMGRKRESVWPRKRDHSAQWEPRGTGTHYTSRALATTFFSLRTKKKWGAMNFKLDFIPGLNCIYSTYWKILRPYLPLFALPIYFRLGGEGKWTFTTWGIYIILPEIWFISSGGSNPPIEDLNSAMSIKKKRLGFNTN